MTRTRLLLRIDAAGAALSAATLGGIMPALHPWVGLPVEVWRSLALPPVLFVLYDLVCLGTRFGDSSRSLLPIATLNLLYCVVSAVTLAQYAQVATWLDVAYIVSELAVVLVLAAIQLRHGRLS
jgi:hypothetical protein